jgi:hypothetical protein
MLLSHRASSLLSSRIQKFRLSYIYTHYPVCGDLICFIHQFVVSVPGWWNLPHFQSKLLSAKSSLIPLSFR